jgi:hypothetical protein
MYPVFQGLSEQSSANNIRKGRLDVYSFKSSSFKDDSPSLLRTHQTEMSAILDIKWSHSKQVPHPQFAVVDADGELSMWQLHTEEIDSGDNGFKAKKLQNVSVGLDRLALSLDWSNRINTR